MTINIVGAVRFLCRISGLMLIFVSTDILDRRTRNWFMAIGVLLYALDFDMF